jgi:hypothetical protein
MNAVMGDSVVKGVWFPDDKGGDVHVYYDSHMDVVCIGRNHKGWKFSDPCLILSKDGCRLQTGAPGGQFESVEVRPEAARHALLMFLSGIEATVKD